MFVSGSIIDEHPQAKLPATKSNDKNFFMKSPSLLSIHDRGTVAIHSRRSRCQLFSRSDGSKTSLARRTNVIYSFRASLFSRDLQMSIPLRQSTAILRYILKQRLRG